MEGKDTGDSGNEKMSRDIAVIKSYVIAFFWIWFVTNMIEFIVSGALFTFVTGNY